MTNSIASRKQSNNHNYHLANFLGSLLVAQQKKKVTCNYWPCSKLIHRCAEALREEGFISGFFLQKERETFRIEVYLKYHPVSLEPLIRKLKVYAKPSYPYNYPYKHLVKLVSEKSDVFFVSTPSGVKTSDYCLSNKIGGNLLFKVR